MVFAIRRNPWLEQPYGRMTVYTYLSRKHKKGKTPGEDLMREEEPAAVPPLFIQEK